MKGIGILELVRARLKEIAETGEEYLLLRGMLQGAGGAGAAEPFTFSSDAIAPGAIETVALHFPVAVRVHAVNVDAEIADSFEIGTFTLGRLQFIHGSKSIPAREFLERRLPLTLVQAGAYSVMIVRNVGKKPCAFRVTVQAVDLTMMAGEP